MTQPVFEFGNNGRPAEPDGRLDAPAFHRNRDAIWAVLEPFLGGKSGQVIEVGSGTGQHVADYAGRHPEITWWPSDLSEQHLKSITAWRARVGLPNIRLPLRIDLSDESWCPEMADDRGPSNVMAIFCANVIHIAPWQVAEGLFSGAKRYLNADGHLFLYGPFKRGGEHTAESNAAFDSNLRSRNPEWGVRDIEAVEKLASHAGFALIKIDEMPANNLVLTFQKSAQKSAAA